MVAAILEFAATNNYKNTVKLLGIPDTFVEHGAIDNLKKDISIDTLSIRSQINNLMNSNI